ncbi:MAG: ATP-binding protein [Bryobacteraceae bacterium]
MRSKIFRICFVTILALTGATLSRFFLDPVVSLKGPFLFFAMGVVFAALYGGPAAGVATTILSIPVCDYLFIGPRYTWFREDTPGDSIMLGLLAALGIAISLLIGKWRRAQENLQRSLSALERSETKLRTLAGAVPGILYTATPSGQWNYVSRGFRDYTGIAEEPLGSAWQRTIHPDDLESFLEAEAQALRDGSAFDAICRLRRSDGQYRWFQCQAKPMRDAEDKIVQWAGISTDIHDRKMLEQALAHRGEELVEAGAEFQTFAYRVSHDLQEPLRTIGIYTELLAQRESGNAEEARATTFILEGVGRIRNQLSQLLDFARSGAERPNRKIVDLNQTLRLALANLNRSIHETGAAVECDSMPSISADPDLILSVFQNLIGNSLKYRSAAPPRIRVSVRPEDQGWKFCIRDNGIGFDMKNAERIFGTFARLNGASKVQGSGLGLAIVKRIIESRGGRIWAQSEPQNGSTFYFTIPAGDSPSLAIPNSCSTDTAPHRT